MAEGAGGPEVLKIGTAPTPRPSARDILVRVQSSGVNRADLLQRRGLYPPPPGAPEILGLEFAGVVEAVGADVTRWRAGERAMGIVAGGGCAERVVVREDVAVPVPAEMDAVAAGAVPEVFMTAFDAMLGQAGLRAGETVLIHAVGSGVGTAALQLARREGARTLGTSRTPAKLARAEELGLDVALDGRGDWATAALDATDGRGADVIVDLAGGAYLAGNQRAAALGGRHVVVGLPAGHSAQIDLRALMTQRARLLGTVLRARSDAEKAALAQEFQARAAPGFTDGSLRPVVDSVYPPEQAADAHARMERNRNFGKIVLAWGDASHDGSPSTFPATAAEPADAGPPAIAE